jgi:Flp pilus assembly protein TadD
MSKSNYLRLLLVVGCLLLLLVGGLGCRQRASAEDYRGFAFRSAKEGLWEEARHRWEKALLLTPGDAGLLNNLAVASEALGELTKAGELYQSAVAAAPGEDIYRNNLLAFRRANPELFPAEEEGEDDNNVE